MTVYIKSWYWRQKAGVTVSYMYRYISHLTVEESTSSLGDFCGLVSVSSGLLSALSLLVW